MTETKIVRVDGKTYRLVAPPYGRAACYSGCHFYLDRTNKCSHPDWPTWSGCPARKLTFLGTPAAYILADEEIELDI